MALDIFSTWMDLENIMLSEIRNAVLFQVTMGSVIWGVFLAW